MTGTGVERQKWLVLQRLFAYTKECTSYSIRLNAFQVINVSRLSLKKDHVESNTEGYLKRRENQTSGKSKGAISKS